MEAEDGPFKKQGSVPFKWEIRPGEPRSKNDPFCPELDRKKPPVTNRSRSDLHTPKMLRPPPAGRLYYQPAPAAEPRTRSFKSAPCPARQERCGSSTARARPVAAVSSDGCLPFPSLLRCATGGKERSTAKPRRPEYFSDVETPSRRSVSSFKSLSHFTESPVSSYFSSSGSSPPRPVSRAEFPGFPPLMVSGGRSSSDQYGVQ
ncbi:unnamed protein product [Cuscuta campestris]|uniref:Uncharacterized protein n=1 Tax=Cuscuta campestris TaxID=132261 RepID=A0A484N2B2_9ASTE|nr:unnamed protein product [Cuscuta campestris]